MQKQFTSDNNKGILWKLMVDNNIFHDIPENKSELIKNEFDKKISLIGMQITYNDQLVGLNKRVISEMVNDLDRHRTKGSHVVVGGQDPPPYNSSEIGQQRQQKFASELKNKQNEFDKLNNKPIPAKIDFLDKNEDTPIGSDMEKLIAAQIASRELELNTVLGKQDKTAASNWIQNGQTATIPAPMHLKIGEPIKIEEKEILNPVKKVKFMEGVSSGVSSPNDDFIMNRVSSRVSSLNDDLRGLPPHDEIGYIPSTITKERSPSNGEGVEDFMTLLKKKTNLVQAPAVVQAPEVLQAPAVVQAVEPLPARVFEMLEEILIKQDMIIRMLINNKIEIGNEQNTNIHPTAQLE